MYLMFVAFVVIETNKTLHHFIAIAVTFSQSEYSVDEDGGPVQPVLVLSNPSSTDITVQVRDTEITATSE